jgi:hypothetical protein
MLWDGESAGNRRSLHSVENISSNGPRNCRSLGCARDDKGDGGAFLCIACWTSKPQVPPLRCAQSAHELGFWRGLGDNQLLEGVLVAR